MKPENLWDSALDLAASTIELYDDATMKGDYMLDASECAAIIRALKSMRLHRDAQPAVAVNDDLAKAIHYPQCWDVAAYPTLAYAISELATCFQCCECVKSPAVAVNEQLLRAAKKYFVNYCLDEASEFFAEDTGCRQEQHDDAVELREAIAAAEAAKGGAA